jgi:hypothetical protein
MAIGGGLKRSIGALRVGRRPMFAFVLGLLVAQPLALISIRLAVPHRVETAGMHRLVAMSFTALVCMASGAMSFQIIQSYIRYVWIKRVSPLGPWGQRKAVIALIAICVALATAVEPDLAVASRVHLGPDRYWAVGAGVATLTCMVLGAAGFWVISVHFPFRSYARATTGQAGNTSSPSFVSFVILLALGLAGLGLLYFYPIIANWS